VAVTGLAGHAFGSWRNRETRLMWLKDFLPQDIKNTRIMTYGYDSRLLGPETTSMRMSDYRGNFIEQLQNSRRSAKVFIVI
jgi:tartrate dehydratase beta subunit/fumarate hydratase class I family protein